MGTFQSITAIAGAQTITTTAETLAGVSLSSVAGPGASGAVISGTVNVTTGTGVTAVVVKVYANGGITGPLLATLTFPVAASTVASFSFTAADLVGYATAAGGTRYAVSVTQTGATGNGTITGGTLCVEI